MEKRRQLVHLSGFLFVLFVSFFDSKVAIYTFGVFALFFLAYSLYIQHQKKSLLKAVEQMENRFRKFLMRFEREEDFQNPFKGAFLFYGSCTLTFLLFPFGIALAACAILSVGDAFATLVGIHGKMKIVGKKTLEGSLAFFLSSYLVALLFVDPAIALTGSLSGMLIELYGRVNDNVSIPIVSAFFMLVAALFV